jgi:hypothetical protein
MSGKPTTQDQARFRAISLYSESILLVSNSQVRRSLKIVAISVLALFGVAIIAGIFSPYTSWYFYVPNARITVDGKKEQGWLHRGAHRETMFLTLRGRGKAESYMIPIPHNQHGFVSSCGQWTAPRFPAFPIGDVNPPCWMFVVKENPTVEPIVPAGDLVAGTNFVEFTADGGGRVRATW